MRIRFFSHKPCAWVLFYTNSTLATVPYPSVGPTVNRFRKTERNIIINRQTLSDDSEMRETTITREPVTTIMIPIL